MAGPLRSIRHLAAAKPLDTAIAAGADAGNDELERVLQASREPLTEQLDKMGLRMPVAIAPKRRGRRRKADATEDITPVLDAVGTAIKRRERAVHA